TAPATVAARRQCSPTRTFSSTVMWGNRRIDWNVRAMPRATIALGRSPTRLAPSNVRRPLSGRTRPVTTLKNVVLPAPLGPISPMMPPRGTTRSTSWRATTPPKRLVRPCTWRIAASRPAGAAEAAGAAEHDHAEQHDRHLELERARRDGLQLGGVDRAGEARERGAEREGEQLGRDGIDAGAVGGRLVLADGHPGAPQPRVVQPAHRPQRGGADDEDQEVPRHRVGLDGHAGQVGATHRVHAVLA